MPKECQLNDTEKKIEWNINEKDLKSIYDVMFDNYEYAGLFKKEFKQGKKCDDYECVIVQNEETVMQTLNKGNSSSVKTEDGYCNFHTHPLACYKGERTVWGWPSGEDMRETIGFMMRGNLCHFVFTLEGVYRIQVNPNYLKILCKKENGLQNILESVNEENYGMKFTIDLIRGIIISLIESVFKATHGHRSIQYNIDERERREKEICEPKNWVQFANEFKLQNITSKKNKDKCSDSLPCLQIPSYEPSEANVTISLPQYLRDYGIDLYEMNSRGQLFNTSKKISEEKCSKMLKDNFNEIINLFNTTGDISYNGEEWKEGQWFKVELFENEFKVKGKYIDYESWFKNMKQFATSEKKTLSDQIHDFWISCGCEELKDHMLFQFKDIKINFRIPIEIDNCELKDGKAMMEHIKKESNMTSLECDMGKNKKKTKTKTKRKTKAKAKGKTKTKAKVSRTNGKKRITKFGQNKYKR